jgi:hydroxypyruvate isomerase
MSGDGPLSMCDPVNKIPYIAYIRQAIAAARIVGCKTLVIHSDSLEDWPQFANRCQEIIRISLGIVPCSMSCASLHP